MIAGYIGKRDVFADAIEKFAFDYARQNERDNAAMVAPVCAGCNEAVTEPQ